MRLQRNVSTLAPLVEHIDCCEGGLHRSPLEWRPFLSALSANSPICGLLHPKVLLTEILRRAVKRRCFMPTDLQILQLNFPLFFELVSFAGYLPSSFFNVIDRMLELSELPFKGDANGHQRSLSETSDDVTFFFPALPKVSPRGTYAADRKERDEGCRKQSPGHPSLLPGIFEIFCQHGNLITNLLLAIDLYVFYCVIYSFVI